MYCSRDQKPHRNSVPTLPLISMIPTIPFSRERRRLSIAGINRELESAVASVDSSYSDFSLRSVRQIKSIVCTALLK